MISLDQLSALIHSVAPLPRSLMLLAHPDDETVGAASLLPRLGADSTLVYVTNGAPDEHRKGASLGFDNPAAYAQARWNELDSVLREAGIMDTQVIRLHHHDQAAAESLTQLTNWLSQWLAGHQPVLLFTHAYEGGHPDHDACAAAAQWACATQAVSGLPVPQRIEFASYFDLGPGLRAGDFIPSAHCLACETPPELVKELNAAQREQRAKWLARFATQCEILDLLPRSHEAYRLAPLYDFTQPPHAGTLLYERWQIGLDGARWRELAAAAQVSLQGVAT